MGLSYLILRPIIVLVLSLCIYRLFFDILDRFSAGKDELSPLGLLSACFEELPEVVCCCD